MSTVVHDGVISFDNEEGFRTRYEDYHILPDYELVFEIAELNVKRAVCNEEQFKRLVTNAGRRRIKKVFAQRKR